MRKLFFIIFIIIPFLSFSQSLGTKRVNKLKETVVRVLIDNQPSGTAFLVGANGLMISCWHVIEPATIRDSISNKITGFKKMSIEFIDGVQMDVGIPRRLLDNFYDEALIYDFVLLKPIEKINKKFAFLPLGDFKQVNEGDAIYSNGYPLGIKQNFISKGILSSKWVDTSYLFNPITESITLQKPRTVAWLDLTLNKGNSGGPVIKIGKTPEQDRVIGIATFILNPFAQDAEKLSHLFENPSIDINMGAVNLSNVNRFFANAISKNSIGVSGCISINHIAEILRQ